jgi:hypothetical protein
MSKRKIKATHSYGVITGVISDAWKQMRSLLAVLFWFQRQFKTGKGKDSILKLIRETLEVNVKDAEKRIIGISCARMVQFLCVPEKIDLWNPKNGVGLLHPDHVASLNRLNTEGKGGISPFLLARIAFAIGKEMVNEFGTGWTRANATDEKLLEIAKKLHAKKDANKRKRALKKGETIQSEAVVSIRRSSETVDENSMTVEQILESIDAGQLLVSELDVQMLEAIHPETSGSLKGQITKQLKKLQA